MNRAIGHLLCTYRLNWARRTSWGWWDEWDDTVLQTQDSKFEPWRSEAEHATSRSRRLPTRGWGRNIFVSFKQPRPGTEPRALAWKAAVLTTTLGPPPNGLWQAAGPPTSTYYINTLLIEKALKVCVLSTQFKLARWFCCPVETSYHVSLLLYLLSHSISNLDWYWISNT